VWNDFWGKDATAQIDCTPEPRKENYIEILFFTSKILTLKKLMFNCHELLTHSREVPLRICTYAARCSLAHSKFDNGSRSLL
jgi:hypothetical protein